MFKIRKIAIITIFSMLLIAVVSGCSTVLATSGSSTPPTTSGSSASPTGAGSSTAPATSSSPATSGTLIVEPQSGLAPYLSLVQSAQHFVDVNSYLLSDQNMVSALIQKAQSIPVKVIVAGNPYHDQKAVAQEQGEFTGTKVQFKTAPARFEGAYVFDHAKYLIADQTAILGSSNLDYSGLGGGNREYDYQTSDPDVVTDLSDVFNADWAGQKADLGNLGPLVVSPGSQDALVSLIQNAKNLYIETEELGNDRPVLNAVAAAAQRGVQVELVLPSKSSAGDRRNAQEMASDGAQVRYLSQPYPHAKLIIADNRAFLGSQNISESSLDKNREVGIVLVGSPVDQLVQVFQRDFAAGVK